MGFYRVFTDNTLDTIPIAVVSVTGKDNILEELATYLEKCKISEEDNLLDIQTCNYKEAKELLAKGKIAGYIICDEKIQLYVRENGLVQTIIKSNIDQYEQWKQTTNNLVAMNPNNKLSNYENDGEAFQIIEGRFKNKTTNYLPFYLIIAAACLFGSYWGFFEMNNIQADQSYVGVRLGIAPIHKFRLVLYNLLAALTIHFTSLVLLSGFMHFLLRVEFGGKVWMLLFTFFLGSICSILLGAMLCVSVRANIKVREAIMNLIIMIGIVMSGSFVTDIKNVVETNAPIIAYLNPISLITDTLYALSYYDGYGKFFLNSFLLTMLTLIFFVITIWNIRRKEYASI